MRQSLRGIIRLLRLVCEKNCPPAIWNHPTRFSHTGHVSHPVPDCFETWRYFSRDALLSFPPTRKTVRCCSHSDVQLLFTTETTRIEPTYCTFPTDSNLINQQLKYNYLQPLIHSWSQTENSITLKLLIKTKTTRKQEQTEWILIPKTDWLNFNHPPIIRSTRHPQLLYLHHTNVGALGRARQALQIDIDRSGIH